MSLDFFCMFSWKRPLQFLPKDPKSVGMISSLLIYLPPWEEKLLILLVRILSVFLGQIYKYVAWVLKSHSFLWPILLASWAFTLKHGERMERRACGNNGENSWSYIIQFCRRDFSMFVETMNIRCLRKQRKQTIKIWVVKLWEIQTGSKMTIKMLPTIVAYIPSV